MTSFHWVQPRGQSPKPGTKLHVTLEQLIDGRPLHGVGRATVYPGNQVCVRLPEGSEAGRTAAEMLREGLVDAVYWGSAPTLRLRP
jgi:hypothetical protein